MSRPLRTSQRILSTIVLASLTSTQCFAAAELEYPELLTAPRASERIKMESETEGTSSWYAHWPLQVPSLALIASGAVGMADSTNTTSVLSNGVTTQVPNSMSYVQLGVGATLLTTTLLMSALYRPYTQAHKRLSSIEIKGKRDELVRERLAEEALRKAHVVGLQLRIMGGLAAAGVGIIGFTGYSGSGAGKYMALAAAGSAIFPFVFSYKWNRIYRQQRMYKKRIYGPIAYTSLTPQEGRDQKMSLAPTLNFSMHF